MIDLSKATLESLAAEAEEEARYIRSGMKYVRDAGIAQHDRERMYRARQAAEWLHAKAKNKPKERTWT